MGNFIVVCIILLAFVGGAACVYFPFEQKRKRLGAAIRLQQSLAQQMLVDRQAIDTKLQELAHEEVRLRALRSKLDNEDAALKNSRSEFEAMAISYLDLQAENTVLKRDLRNIHVGVRKVQLDVELQKQTQKAVEEKVNEVGNRYLKDNIKWISSGLNSNNFAASKQRLQDAIERCRGIGLNITGDEEAGLMADLKEEYRKAVRAALEREEQARIKAQIREELIREKEKEELERKREKLAREHELIKAAVERALAEAKGQHSAEIEQLNKELAAKQTEIDENQRAISQAQITKSGHVYVISNIGSFGEGIFKIGMTRRLKWEERIDELSGAAVPFPYDVHMRISANDAPGLEAALHRKLHKQRVNKANPRKEFFRADIESIHQIVKEHHGEVDYVVVPEALQYRQSVQMSDADQEIIDEVYDELDEEGHMADEEV
jgi:hypothetical protein